MNVTIKVNMKYGKQLFNKEYETKNLRWYIENIKMGKFMFNTGFLNKTILFQCILHISFKIH